ncbi:serine/threonine protein kinase [Baekduia soli]|uniref:non-specific serine/threonine protein kinase n=1 Tax=Baekduia soli TaxID=496014 RepID=A0A5B8U1W4_9ACTN|nr:protein kinase [Baekduia soli]QEC46815.1 serine/threonine protein kinase [Baekduia soli]
MSSQVGTLLNGRYRLDAQIGTGGMSTVYRAFDTVLERQVAIKLMHREIASDSDQLERFRREARAVAQLNHPHIVTVIDAGEDDNTPYIVLEYVEGETLKDRIRRFGRLPVSEAVAYAIEISRALGIAHERGIVHRDVKPQNVLVDEEGSAKVTDFGIARTLDQEGLTADGRVLGTTDYVSPEQALGHPVTGQSDLYSLGIVLFEMLTGDVPFKGDNQVAVAMKHVREQLPDVQMRRPEVSSALAAVLDRATAKDLDHRYADDRAFIADLEDVLAIETARSGQATGQATAVLRTLPPSARRRLPVRVTHPVRLLLALAAVAGVVVLAIVLLADRTQRGTGQPRNVVAPPGLRSVSLAQSGAGDFDPPPGDGQEHHDQVRAIIDRDPNSTWSTESYQNGVFASGKKGVGIYVDAHPSAAARVMEIRSPVTGWEGQIYVASSGPPKTLDGWQRVADFTITAKRQRVQLDTARQRFRYYLVWITKLPPGRTKAEISEVLLFQ